MAYDPNQQDPNKQPDQGQPAQPALPTTSAPGSGPGASSGKATPQSAPAQPFQNLQSYLTANQPQIQAQGTKIAGDLSNQYGQVTSDINKAKTDFGTQVESGYAKPDENIINSASSNPTDFVSKPENVKAFQSLYNDQYTGPDAFENTTGYGNVSGEAGKAASDAALLNTPEGVQNYFANQNPTATKGGNVLDSVLLQGSPEVYGQIQNAVKPFAGLNDYLTGTVNEANQGVTQAKQTANKTAQDLKNKFTGEGGIIPSFQTELQDKLGKAKTDAQTQADFEKMFLQTGTPVTGGGFYAGPSTSPQKLYSNEDLDKTFTDFGGVKPEDMANLFNLKNIVSQGFSSPDRGTVIPGQNVDLSTYLTSTPPTNLGIQNVTSQDDYAKAAALASLTGDQSINLSGQPSPLDLNSFAYQDALDYLTPMQQAIAAESRKGLPPPVAPPAGTGDAFTPPPPTPWTPPPGWTPPPNTGNRMGAF